MPVCYSVLTLKRCGAAFEVGVTAEAQTYLQRDMSQVYFANRFPDGMGLRVSTQLGPLVASAPDTSESNRATCFPASA